MSISRFLTICVGLIFSLQSGFIGSSFAQPIPAERLGLLSEVVGFGRNAAGGSGGSLYQVTTLNDSGAGSLRQGAESSGALWIVFNVSGTIWLNSPIDVESNKTIDGRGQSIIITNYGLDITSQQNVILTNLILVDGDDDAIKLYGDTHDVWIHHVDISNFYDGAIDITRGATDATVSWSLLHDHEKVMLLGGSDSNTEDVNIRVTLHHNYFLNGYERHPRLRRGKVHAYNNYLKNWGIYGMRIHLGGQLLSEGNIFEAGDDTDALIPGDDSDVKIRSSGDLLLNGAEAIEVDPAGVFDPASFYAYTSEPATNELRSRIAAEAGWRPGTPTQDTVPPAAPVNLRVYYAE